MKEQIITNLLEKNEIELKELLDKITKALNNLENEVIDFEK